MYALKLLTQIGHTFQFRIQLLFFCLYYLVKIFSFFVYHKQQWFNRTFTSITFALGDIHWFSPTGQCHKIISIIFLHFALNVKTKHNSLIFSCCCFFLQMFTTMWKQSNDKWQRIYPNILNELCHSKEFEHVSHKVDWNWIYETVTIQKGTQRTNKWNLNEQTKTELNNVTLPNDDMSRVEPQLYTSEWIVVSEWNKSWLRKNGETVCRSIKFV